VGQVSNPSWDFILFSRRKYNNKNGELVTVQNTGQNNIVKIRRDQKESCSAQNITKQNKIM
jgi:hypothetical protein